MTTTKFALDFTRIAHGFALTAVAPGGARFALDLTFGKEALPAAAPASAVEPQASPRPVPSPEAEHRGLYAAWEDYVAACEVRGDEALDLQRWRAVGRPAAGAPVPDYSPEEWDDVLATFAATRPQDESRGERERHVGPGVLAAMASLRTQFGGPSDPPVESERLTAEQVRAAINEGFEKAKRESANSHGQ